MPASEAHGGGESVPGRDGATPPGKRRGPTAKVIPGHDSVRYLGHTELKRILPASPQIRECQNELDLGGVKLPSKNATCRIYNLTFPGPVEYSRKEPLAVTKITLHDSTPSGREL